MVVSSVSPLRCGDDRRIAGSFGHFDGFQGFRKGADLVDLDQDGVGNSFFDPFLEYFGVGDEQVVTDNLDALAQALGDEFPAVPVIFGHAVLNGDDGIAVDQVFVKGDQLRGAFLGLGLSSQD